MAYSVRIDAPARRGLVALSGTVRGDDLVGAITGLYGHEDWEPAFDTLWDATGITELILDPVDLQRVMEAAGPYVQRLGTGRSALVVARDVDVAIAKLILHRQKGDASQRDRRLFERLEEAIAWLDKSNANSEAA